MIQLHKIWHTRLSHYDQLLVGFSGGLDSTVLLHLLASEPNLKNKIRALHINHGVSPDADDWQAHCISVCETLDISLVLQTLSFKDHSNFEEKARKGRHQLFVAMLQKQGCLLLAHHQDDQVETLLLNLFRGAGIDGLSAMAEVGRLGNHPLFRPLLPYTRKQLEQYAVDHHLTWVNDESNLDLQYSRNFLRHQVIPLIQSKWPGMGNAITRTALHCQDARTSLDELARSDSANVSLTVPTLPIQLLISLDAARRRNVLRLWLKKNKIPVPTADMIERIFDEMIHARQDAMPKVSFGDVTIHRYKGHLYWEKETTTSSIPKTCVWTDFPNDLYWSNQTISAKKAKEGLLIPEGASIEVTQRQGGETFKWHGQTKQLKKLFQAWNIPPWERDSIPLVYINDECAAVVGYAVSDLFFTKDEERAWVLSCLA